MHTKTRTMNPINKTLFAALMLGIGTLSHAAPNGETVYKQNCAMCHASGVAKAPKFGDKDAWEPRIATGRDALLKSVLNGKGVMPPKGGNAKLTDEEAAAAMDHMIKAAQ